MARDIGFDHRNQFWNAAKHSAANALAAAKATGAAVASLPDFWHSTDLALALMVGLLATPLAPIAKNLSSALVTAVNTMQLVKK